MRRISPQIVVAVLVFAVIAGVYFVTNSLATFTYDSSVLATTTVANKDTKEPIIPPTLDKALYNKKMISLANNPIPKFQATTTASTTSSTASSSPASLYAAYISGLLASTSSSTSVHIPGKDWPVPTVYPKYGALLPFNRIVAYYGNFYSKNMGVLGEYPEDQMLSMLKGEAKKWEEADPTTPVIPAIHYIVTTAQGSAGDDGMYRLRMPGDQIEKAIELAEQVHGIVFLDVQVGLSTLQAELPRLEPYLKLPNVHLAIDPEFSMKTGAKPGTVIGTFSSADVNYAAQFLQKITNDNNLPPKILIVHRFTRPMVTGYENIKPLPEVQIVMDMDGWGPPAQKIGTYTNFIVSEPVQFTGFKLFYKNDLRGQSPGMLTPEELLKLTPRPSYIQYQ